jgi:oligosaccharyl transferase (archaeosortase A-associated)
MRNLRIPLAVGGLSAVAFLLRARTASQAFENGSVMFAETDPWYHVRSIEHLVRNFPWRMDADPYSAFHFSGHLATAPFFDYVIALAAWIAGLGHPSEHTIEVMAAWYPAILGTLLVPVIFLLGQRIFGTRAGLIGAAILATLPGHFLRTEQVGYTDHHVMESLLTAVLFLVLLRAIEKPGLRSIASGLALGAYLLTFVGGAFLVAIVLVWTLFEQVRSRRKPAMAVDPIVWTFLIALLMIAPSYRTLWMNYSIAALAGGVVAITALEFWRRRIDSQTIFVAGLLAPVAGLAIAIAVHPAPFRILTRLVPAFSGNSGGVAELQSIFDRGGVFSLQPVWVQFGGAVVLALAGILILGEMALRRPEAGRDLIFFYAFATMLFTAGQVRMTYYFAIAVALLCGFIADRMLRGPSYLQWPAALGIAGLVFAANIYQALQVGPGESPNADWREALTWLRRSTPEPFGDEGYYLARYPEHPPQASYSVMSWWDYGYWITALGRRVPVSNPTQFEAGTAAACLLAQNEAEAAAIMEKSRARYLVLDPGLPMLEDGRRAGGKFPALFLYDRELSLDDYYMIAKLRTANGATETRVLYRPAYFQSLLVRLFVLGGEAVTNPPATLAWLRDDGKSREIVDLRDFPTEQQARAEEVNCRYQGCILVSTSPLQSCVTLDAITRFRQVFASSTGIAKTASGLVRKEIQIYEFK